MNIKIDDTYSIKSDLRNVILVENKVVQEGENAGKEYEENISFHATLENALKDYKRVMINTSDATSVKQLLERVAEIDKTIEKVLGGI
jgi:hypothetical protein